MGERVFSSRFLDVVIPERTLQDVVMENWLKHPDKIAAIDAVTGRSVTYGQQAARVRALASALRRRGLRQGATLLLVSATCPEYVQVLLAVISCGGVVSTANPAYTTAEIARQIRDSGSTFIYVQRGVHNNVMAAARQMDNIKEVFSDVDLAGCIPLRILLQDDGSAYPRHLKVDLRRDVILLPYSSGTTGLPKGVELTHYSVVANYIQCSHPDVHILPSEDDVVLTFLPFFHSFGLFINCVFAAAACATVVTMARFEAKSFLRCIEKFKVTMVDLVPPVVVMLSKSPLVKEYNLSSLRSILCGAAPLEKQTEEEFLRNIGLPHLQLTQGYGMTEMSPVMCLPPADGKWKRGSSGMLVSNLQAMVVDTITGRPVGTDERGELWVRGPNTLKGYHNRPDENKKSFKPGGWFATGDVVTIDSDGYVFIMDRIKELIKYKAFQVAPAELEAALLEHPAVADCAVFGRPDPAAGELPTALVVRRAAVSRQELLTHMKQRLTSYKQLRGGIVFTNSIPKSNSGKILRSAVKAMYKQMVSKL